MSWILLENPIEDSGNTYWELPVSNQAGILFVLVPGFSEPTGSIYLGIGDRVEGQPPIQVDFKLEGMKPFGRTFKFEIPQLPRPVLGIRLEGAGESVEVQPSYQFHKYCNQEELMAFYCTPEETTDNSIQRLDSIPAVEDFSEGDVFIYKPTGETVSLVDGRFLGEVKEQDDYFQAMPDPNALTGAALDFNTNCTYQLPEIDGHIITDVFFTSKKGEEGVRAFVHNWNKSEGYLSTSTDFDQNQLDPLNNAGADPNGAEVLWDGADRRSFDYGAVSEDGGEVMKLVVRYRKVYEPAAE